ncbi:MAG: hypothetical protein IT353_10580 [Gemmatimonadaceae bacterium]|nr:hypothetical protein [Gemmatimonadaceae bacterium]
MQRILDRVHARARAIGPLYRLAIVSRALLALAFIPTGMVKLLGQRFTSLGIDTPVGAFFEAMYQSGFYWNFIGAGQIIAALLLLIPATSTLGAVAFFPIMLNITVVTWSVGFSGTVYVTSLMLLANVFLLCWDYDRWRAIVFAPETRVVPVRMAPLPRVERVGYVVGVTATLVMLLVSRGLVSSSAMLPMLIVGVVGALLVVGGWVAAWRNDR